MNVATRQMLMLPGEAIPHEAQADSFDVRAAFQTLGFAIRSRPRMIILTTLVAVSLVVLYIMIWPPVYQTKVTLISATDKDTKREQFYADWAVFRRDDLNNEIKLFSSGPVLTRVIRKLDLHYDDVYHPLLSHLTYLWRISPPGRLWRWTKDTIWPRPDPPTPAEEDFALTLGDLKEGVALLPVGDSTVGELTVRGPSPRVQEMANAVVDIYMDERRNRFAQEADSAYAALSVESEKARIDLLANERRLEQYYSQSDMLLMFEKDKVNIAQQLAQRGSMVDLQTQISQAGSELDTVRGQLRRAPADYVAGRTVTPNNIHQGIVDKTAQLELARRVALIHYQPDAPEVVEMDRQIAALKAQQLLVPTEMVTQTSLARSSLHDGLRQRAEALEAQIAGARAALSVKQRDYAVLTRQVDAIPQKMKVSHALGREHDILEKKYMALQDKLSVAAVSRATARSAPPSFAVIERAGRPDSPIMPKSKLFIAIAVLVGLLSGVLLAIVSNTFQGLVSRVTLANRRGGTPLYAIVEQEPGHANRVFHL